MVVWFGEGRAECRSTLASIIVVTRFRVHVSILYPEGRLVRGRVGGEFLQAKGVRRGACVRVIVEEPRVLSLCFRVSGAIRVVKNRSSGFLGECWNVIVRASVVDGSAFANFRGEVVSGGPFSYLRVPMEGGVLRRPRLLSIIRRRVEDVVLELFFCNDRDCDRHAIQVAFVVAAE